MNGSEIMIALNIVIQLAEQVQKVANMMATAQSEGRDITLEELEGLRSADDMARMRLQDLIDRAADPTLSASDKTGALVSPALPQDQLK